MRSCAHKCICKQEDSHSHTRVAEFESEALEAQLTIREQQSVLEHQQQRLHKTKAGDENMFSVAAEAAVKFCDC